MGKKTCDRGLGSAGIIGRGIAPAILADIQRGWQSARMKTSDEVGFDLLDTQIDDWDTLVELPPEGRTIMLRALSESPGDVVAQICLFPPFGDASLGHQGEDAIDDAAGCQSGWVEAAAQTFTTSATYLESNAISEEAAAEHGYLSNYILIDRKGAARMGVRILSVQTPTEVSEIQYRVF